MYGFDQAKTALGLDTIFSIVSQNCVSQLGKESLYNFTPATSKSELKQKLSLLADIKNIISKEGRLPLRSFADIRVLLNKIEPQNSFLEIKECQEIQNVLEIVDDLFTHFKNP